jgi:hypothetical protein
VIAVVIRGGTARAVCRAFITEPASAPMFD